MSAVMEKPAILSLFKSSPLVIASHNKGKVKEIGELIASLGIRVISASEANVDEPEETGDSFAENATLKSEYSAQITHLPSLSDDSGLVVPAIGGAPGIYSARWAGPDKNFTVAFNRIQKELGDLPTHAYFVCVLSLSIPESFSKELAGTHIFEGRTDGTLTFPPRGDNGFGYDPIFIPDGHSETFGELPADYKNSISHRAAAFAQFIEFLKDNP